MACEQFYFKTKFKEYLRQQNKTKTKTKTKQNNNKNNNNNKKKNTHKILHRIHCTLGNSPCTNSRSVMLNVISR